jgi:NAD(P)H-nitrite reductase large subunit
MNDIIVDDFQNSVSDSLIRHRSIIDIMTKFNESSARVSRALAKSVTTCGCISVSAHKQKLPDDVSLNDISSLLSYQIDGELCGNCKEIIEEEIGTNLYYLAALCDSLDISLFDIIIKKYDRLQTLGKFTML